MKTAKAFWVEKFGSYNTKIDSITAIKFAEQYAQQNTLNRDKVMEVFMKHGVSTYGRAEREYSLKEFEEAVDSLSLPTLSEGAWVKCSERLPTKSDCYGTSIGEMHFDSKTKIWGTKGVSQQPKKWFDLNVPTLSEGEIKDVADKYARYGPPEARQIDTSKRNAFMHGALWQKNHGFTKTLSEGEIDEMWEKYSERMLNGLKVSFEEQFKAAIKELTKKE